MFTHFAGVQVKPSKNITPPLLNSVAASQALDRSSTSATSRALMEPGRDIEMQGRDIEMQSLDAQDVRVNVGASGAGGSVTRSGYDAVH